MTKVRSNVLSLHCAQGAPLAPPPSGPRRPPSCPPLAVHLLASSLLASQVDRLTLRENHPPQFRATNTEVLHFDRMTKNLGGAFVSAEGKVQGHSHALGRTRTHSHALGRTRTHSDALARTHSLHARAR